MIKGMKMHTMNFHAPGKDSRDVNQPRSFHFKPYERTPYKRRVGVMIQGML